MRNKGAVDDQHRRERGLLDYRQSDVSELRNFVEARGLAKMPKRTTSKKRLIQTLEDADDQMSFGHFMDLPPELRVSIYNLHLQSLKKPNFAAQPPITKVSKTIRQETLPLFYRNMHATADLTEHVMLSQMTTVPKVSLEPQRYRDHLTSSTLSRFDKILLHYTAHVGSPRTSTAWIIDISAGDSIGRMKRIVQNDRSDDEDVPEVLRASVERRIQELVTELLTRPVEQRLHHRDFQAMAKAVEEAVQEYWSRSER